jgi:hypothetical protein
MEFPCFVPDGVASYPNHYPLKSGNQVPTVDFGVSQTGSDIRGLIKAS